MRKFFITILTNCLLILKKYFIIPFLAALFILAVYLLIRFKLNKSDKNFIDFVKMKIKNSLKIFVSVFWVLFIFQITIFSRIGLYEPDPFRSLWDNWLISEMEYQYDITFLYNIIIFVPLAFIISQIWGYEKNKKAIVQTTAAAFALSLLIESIQAIFHLGTFQISDLFYNTLGGTLGALILVFIKKYIKNKKNSY